MLTMRNGGVFAPVDRLSRLREDMDRLFEGIWQEPVLDSAGGWAPPLDVQETAEELRCSLEVPGLSSEDLEVTVDRNVLTVSGEKRFEREQNARVHRTERRYGRFTRSIALPSNVEVSAIRAEHRDGVLTVILPKSAESRPRRVAIEPVPAGRRLTEGEGKAG